MAFDFILKESILNQGTSIIRRRGVSMRQNLSSKNPAFAGLMRTNGTGKGVQTTGCEVASWEGRLRGKVEHQLSWSPLLLAMVLPVCCDKPNLLTIAGCINCKQWQACANARCGCKLGICGQVRLMRCNKRQDMRNS